MDTSHEPVPQIHLPRSRFRSDDIPAADRFAAWSDSIALLFRPHLAPGLAPAACRITTEAFLLGETVLGKSTMFGVGGYRNPGSSPLREAAEVYIIQYFWRGGFTGYNGAQAVPVTPGDIVIMDATRPLTLNAVFDSRVLTYVVPRRALLDMLGHGANLYPRVFSGRSVPGQILANTLLATWHGLPQQTMATARAVSGLLLGAFAGLLRGSSEDTADPALDHATLETICAYIERHVNDPELGPDRLCRQFHLSRARLYRLFAPLDGVAAYIRKVRLERCYAALLTAPHKVNVAALALEWGFGNVSHFNRLFRAAYGVVPREVRGAAGSGTTPHESKPRSPGLLIPEYQQWLEHF